MSPSSSLWLADRAIGERRDWLPRPWVQHIEEGDSDVSETRPPACLPGMRALSVAVMVTVAAHSLDAGPKPVPRVGY